MADLLTPRQMHAFKAKCVRCESGCLEWTSSKNDDGYGEFMVSPRRWRAHRLAWTLVNGPIPDGLHVLHRCDNPGCVEPSHLFLGTHADNMADCARKGRAAGASAAFLRAAKRCKEGALNPRAKLTPDAVQAIRASAEPAAALARKFRVTTTAVRMVRAGKTWAGV